VPFCTRACHYCDFTFTTNTKKIASYLEALKLEIEASKGWFNDKSIKTLYWGGGTPSILGKAELEEIIQKLREVGVRTPLEECTLELNPEHATKTYLSALKEIDINRLSIGIQSFDDKFLQSLNRSHSATKATDAVALAKDTGFQNISIDLMFALPGQTLDELKKDVEKALALHSTHISLYQLTIEDKTYFGRQLAKGKLSPSEETLQAVMLEYIIDTLTDAGFEHYEISNFAKPGYRAVHNSAYWNGRAYRGFGPGAHSFDGYVTRGSNSTSVGQYIQKSLAGISTMALEHLSPTQRLNESMMTGLRTIEGFNFRLWEESLQVSWFDINQKKLDYWKDNQYLEIVKDRIVLNRKGKLVADHITSDLMI
jgi:oxygen-independent coproporphyrinogen-3 oxidase